MKSVLRKGWCCFFALIIAFGTVISSVPTKVFADDGQAQISINRAYLKANTPLSVNNPNDYALKFFKGDEELGVESYIPTEQDYESWLTVKAYNGDQEVAADSVYFSKLPVLYINTDDGNAITSKTEYKPGTMTIQNNTESSSAMYDGVIKIKGRGNTTWAWPKKPYRIKLDKKTNLFGMGKNKNWVLLANYLDECSMRYSTAVKLSNEIGLTTMDCVWTDVVLNGEYAGMYQLCENIRIDDDRVEIFDWEDEAENVAAAVVKAEKKKGNILDKDLLEDTLKENLLWITTGTFSFDETDYTVSDYYQAEDNISGGYLLELSNSMDEVSQFTTGIGLCVMVNSPEYLTTNDQMMGYVQNYFQDLEDAYTSDDGYTQTTDGLKHYSELADFDSMVGYWLVMEILGNVDAAWRSRFAYKDIDGLLHYGPVWDFDWGSGSLKVTHHPYGWQVTNGKMEQRFFKEFVDDPYFISKASEQYWKIRPYMESLIEDGGLLDADFNYICEAGVADAERWDRKVSWPDDARGFLLDSEMYKTYLKKRFKWLDQQFENDDSLLSSLRSDYSASPYTKDPSLGISFSKAHSDIYSAHAAAKGAIGEDESLKVNLCAKDNETKSVNVYINGMFYTNVVLNDNKAAIEIDNSMLNGEKNTKNVISVVGKDSSNNSTRRNYITVIVSDLAPDQTGDVNFDGTVSISDASFIQRHLAEYLDEADVALLDETDEETLALADIDKDGAISIRDVTEIQRYLAEIRDTL